jgi:hypothetical protein
MPSSIRASRSADRRSPWRFTWWASASPSSAGGGPLELPRLRQSLAAPKRIFPWLEPPSIVGALTVLDVHQAATPAEHRQRVNEWARSAWEAWAPHHAQVRAWADELR